MKKSELRTSTEELEPKKFVLDLDEAPSIAKGVSVKVLSPSFVSRLKQHLMLLGFN